MKLQLVATNNTDYTITVLVDDVRYEYWLKGNYAQVESTLRKLIKQGASGKAINLLKVWSSKVDRL